MTKALAFFCGILCLSFGQTIPAECGSTGWLCTCSTEISNMCDSTKSKGEIFNCLRFGAEQNPLSAECKFSVDERIKRIEPNNAVPQPGIQSGFPSAPSAPLSSSAPIPPDCGQTGWKCECEKELTEQCKDIELTDSPSLWTCLTEFASTVGVSSSECQESIESRLRMIQQQQMTDIITIPAEALTDLLLSSSQLPVMRFRQAIKKKVCLTYNSEKATHTTSKCNDGNADQGFFFKQGPRGYKIMRSNPGGEQVCLTADLTYVTCSKTDFFLEAVRLPSQAIQLSSGKKCLTALPQEVTLNRCSKKSKKQHFFVEPVINQEPSMAIEDAGEVLASSLSKAMSQILAAEVGKMERALYQQMEYMLQEAGIQLTYDGVETKGSDPAPPPMPIVG